MFTCLHLPLLDILQHNLPINHINFNSFTPPDHLFAGHPGVKKLLVVDVFTFDYTLQTIRLRDHLNSEFTRYPRMSRKVAQWFKEHKLYLQPFFLANFLQAPRPSLTRCSLTNPLVDLSSLCHKIIFPSALSSASSSRISLNSIKYYKKLILPNTISANTSNLTPSQWRQFWSLDIPLNSRTIWYR